MCYQKNKTIIYVPSDQECRCEGCHLNRWKSVKALTHLSRRKLVLEIEQFFARAFDIEFRLIDTNEIYEPAFCWEDIDGRWVSQYLESDSSGEQPKIRIPRNLEYQRQIELYLLGTIAQRMKIVEALRQAHGHPCPKISRNETPAISRNRDLKALG